MPTPEQARYQAALDFIRLSDDLRLFVLLASLGYVSEDEIKMRTYGVREAETRLTALRPRNTGQPYRRPVPSRTYREERGSRP